MTALRVPALVIGVLLTVLAAGMVLPALVDLYLGNPDWQVFLVSAFVTGFVGAALALASRGGGTLEMRDAFLLTTFSWIVLPAFAAVPFAISALDLSYTDAYFEAMSGITTTGSTVISGLDSAPPGILMWRSLLQWLGGIGIIVTAIAVLPMLGVGGMQLFRMESSDRSDKALPRVTQIASVIGTVYLVLTLVCAGLYWAAGMSLFEAVAHAMTTIATGGFSTSDGSIGHFDSALIDYTAAAFMVIGSLPFLLYFQFVRGRPMALITDSQVRVFLGLVLVLVAIIAAWLVFEAGRAPLQALRLATFNLVSIITGTGYATADYGAWGGFTVTLFFFVMFIGGCAGSTSCGIKIFRFQILYGAARTQVLRLLRPHGVFTVQFNGRAVSEPVMDAVMSFLFLFILSFAALSVLLTLIGLDLVTAVSGAATAIANVGPGLGPTIGPSGTFGALPDVAKWLLSAGMLLGRLEFFTVLVLFTRTFWRA